MFNPGDKVRVRDRYADPCVAVFREYTPGYGGTLLAKIEYGGGLVAFYPPHEIEHVLELDKPFHLYSGPEWRVFLARQIGYHLKLRPESVDVLNVASHVAVSVMRALQTQREEIETAVDGDPWHRIAEEYEAGWASRAWGEPLRTERGRHFTKGWDDCAANDGDSVEAEQAATEYVANLKSDDDKGAP